MAIAFVDDKTIRATKSDNTSTADAVLSGILSVREQLLVQFPGVTAAGDVGLYPSSHQAFSFVGTMVPNNTNLPDSLAPIGSTFLRLEVSGGEIISASNYTKVSAATWEISTSASPANFISTAELATALSDYTTTTSLAANYLATDDLEAAIEGGDFSGLPTTDPAVAGKLWVSSGAVKVSAG